MRLKICGICDLNQASAIAQMGADTLGFISVKDSPRYITPDKIKEIVKILPTEISKVGVFVNASGEEIVKIVEESNITAIQLHGDEKPSLCAELRDLFPDIEIIKVFRYQNRESLQSLDDYIPFIDTILLDTYQENTYGGTGKTFNWAELTDFRPSRPWLIAGGLNPNNVLDALKTLKCDGVDVSSGVEISPGNKNLNRVGELVQHLNSLRKPLNSSI